MKKFFKNFSLLGIFMLGLCIVLGVGEVSGAVMSADGVGTQIDGGGKPAEGNAGLLI